MTRAISNPNPGKKQVWLGPSPFIFVENITGISGAKQG